MFTAARSRSFFRINEGSFDKRYSLGSLKASGAGLYVKFSTYKLYGIISYRLYRRIKFLYKMDIVERELVQILYGRKSTR